MLSILDPAAELAADDGKASSKAVRMELPSCTTAIFGSTLGFARSNSVLKELVMSWVSVAALTVAAVLLLAVVLELLLELLHAAAPSETAARTAIATTRGDRRRLGGAAPPASSLRRA